MARTKAAAKWIAAACRDKMFRRGLLVAAGVGIAFLLAAGQPIRAADATSVEDAGSAAEVAGSAQPGSTFFQVCKGQTYALCAVASCFVFNQLAYCQCQVKSGDSISLPFRFGHDQDVCTVNAEGAKNGYMVSTFSVPESVVVPRGDQALYTCPRRTSDGAYAQCDGGICFTSTQGQSFPGFAKPSKADQIICSCPITVAKPSTAKLGYQIAGPFPCQESFFENCKRITANNKTGSTIFVGAPTGTARFLARQLNGQVPTLHQCLPPKGS